MCVCVCVSVCVCVCVCNVCFVKHDKIIFLITQNVIKKLNTPKPFQILYRNYLRYRFINISFDLEKKNNQIYEK